MAASAKYSTTIYPPAIKYHTLAHFIVFKFIFIILYVVLFNNTFKLSVFISRIKFIFYYFIYYFLKAIIIRNKKIIFFERLIKIKED
jgi:hypothetical protein